MADDDGLKEQDHNTLEWDDLFMSLAYLMAMKSHDLSTRLGAVVVDQDHSVRSTGYNGLPRGLEYTEPRITPPTKYLYAEHAERNAIYNACRFGVSLKDCTMYTHWIPCADCARAIVQVGIKMVVVHKNCKDLLGVRWEEPCRVGLEILQECGVEIRMHSRSIATVSCLIGGGWYEV